MSLLYGCAYVVVLWWQVNQGKEQEPIIDGDRITVVKTGLEVASKCEELGFVGRHVNSWECKSKKIVECIGFGSEIRRNIESTEVVPNNRSGWISVSSKDLFDYLLSTALE